MKIINLNKLSTLLRRMVKEKNSTQTHFNGHKNYLKFKTFDLILTEPFYEYN